MTAPKLKTQVGDEATGSEPPEPDEQVVELPPPTNVIAAIARVMAEIGGIRKLTPMQRRQMGMSGGDAEGIKYAYRGIDQLAQHAQPLFGKYGVVIVPNVTDVEIDKVLKGGATMENTQWTRTTVTVEWTLYGPSYGPDSYDLISTVVHGIGDDNSDKGYNKAMTASFKNLLLRILCIGDPQDDPDGLDSNQPGADDRGEPPDAKGDRPLGATVFEYIRDEADPKLKVLLRQFAVDKGKSLSGKALLDDDDWAKQVQEAIAGHLEAQAQDAAAEAPQDRVEGGDAPVESPGEVGETGDPTLPPSTEPEPDKVKPGSAAKRTTPTDVSEETKTDG